MYEPPFERSATIDSLAMETSEMVGRLVAGSSLSASPTLHRRLRIQTIYSSLATEGNDLAEEQVTAILEGKRVLGRERDIREVQNADRAYALLDQLDPCSLEDLLRVHGVMMDGLVAHPGTLRSANVGVYDGERLIHAGTPARYVPMVLGELFQWLASTDMHPLLSSCVFHYEFEFIHPFEDGNGRCGRLWHTLLLARWRPALAYLPVESVILHRQDEYYAALTESNTRGESGPFVQFMLEAIREALTPFCGQPATRESREEAIMRLMRENPRITLPALAQRLGVSQSTVERAVADLRARGRVTREGNRRSGIWQVPQSLGPGSLEP